MEVDAAQRLDLVRLLDVRRTPTVFVLGPDGRVTRRGSGLMRKDDVLARPGGRRVKGNTLPDWWEVTQGPPSAYHRGRAFPGHPG